MLKLQLLAEKTQQTSTQRHRPSEKSVLLTERNNIACYLLKSVTVSETESRHQYSSIEDSFRRSFAYDYKRKYGILR